MNTLVTAMATVDLSSQWTKFWNTLKGAAGFSAVIDLAVFVGIALVAFALLKWAWDRRRGAGGGGRGSQGVVGALVIGLVLIAPDILFPIAFQIIDVVANAALKVWENAT